jgi:hypothetical protein
MNLDIEARCTLLLPVVSDIHCRVNYSIRSASSLNGGSSFLPLGRQQLLLSNLMLRSGQFRLKASSETALLCLQYSLDHLLATAAIKPECDSDMPCLDPAGRATLLMNKVRIFTELPGKRSTCTNYYRVIFSTLMNRIFF